jgi:hypothetical protein
MATVGIRVTTEPARDFSNFMTIIHKVYCPTTWYVLASKICKSREVSPKRILSWWFDSNFVGTAAGRFLCYYFMVPDLQGTVAMVL